MIGKKLALQAECSDGTVTVTILAGTARNPRKYYITVTTPSQ